ncbi:MULTISPECIES: NAD(P)/FAD-dependent oxidoreductase [Yersiniaceae]|uniref:NAD(P)/FAD-dependent oxidoreductase n=1 Tax=Yersiniaceae TaxID=1903411 RepID=UPI000934E088|nr:MULTISPECIES: FAD-binding oxidoreductase [Yersiniaceae]MDV5139291.1 FAD-binding oxidoreductase [Chimaeribacter arupi]PLR30690.1 FAD-binding oxidoreductase [Chimaeribacter arupi]
MKKIDRIPGDDTSCGWYHLSPPRRARPPHQGYKTARWTLVGAGLTGLAAARTLAEHFPDEEIILIDAQEVGMGASGRNSGFAIDLPHDIGAKDYIGDIDAARKVLTLNQFAQQKLTELIERFHIPCQLEHTGKYQCAIENKGIRVLEAYQRGLDKLGQAYQVIDKTALPDHIGTAYYQAGLYTPGTKLLQPATLVKGLADSLPNNVTLYENTLITGVEYGDTITLVHNRGKIVTRKLILTNNAFASGFGFYPRALLPVFTYGGLTRPLTAAEQQALGGHASWGIIPADPYGTTLRRTPDNRILIRNGFSFNPDGKSRPNVLNRVKALHQRAFNERFPMLRDVTFEYHWGGAMSLSRNHAGHFGQLKPHVYGAFCCNGLGITKGTASGILLADWLAGERNTMIDFLLNNQVPNSNPPEPLLSLGVNLTLAWGHYAAGTEI